MKIAIASDHGGFNLKTKVIEHLKNKYEVVDFGTNSEESCDYPVYANKVVDAILNQKFDRGILICGTGIGMAICANRYKGIRASNVSDTYSARLTRLHNNSNVLTLGARTLGDGLAMDIIDIWLNTDFEGGRHQKRIDMIDK